MHHKVTAVVGVGGQREVDAERVRDRGARGVDVHERDPDAGEPGEEPSRAAADHAGADDRDPVAEQRCSHKALTAVSTVPARTARSGGTSSGTTDTACVGTT